MNFCHESVILLGPHVIIKTIIIVHVITRVHVSRILKAIKIDKKEKKVQYNCMQIHVHAPKCKNPGPFMFPGAKWRDVAVALIPHRGCYGMQRYTTKVGCLAYFFSYVLCGSRKNSISLSWGCVSSLDSPAPRISHSTRGFYNISVLYLPHPPGFP